MSVAVILYRLKCRLSSWESLSRWWVEMASWVLHPLLAPAQYQPSQSHEVIIAFMCTHTHSNIKAGSQYMQYVALWRVVTGASRAEVLKGFEVGNPSCGKLSRAMCTHVRIIFESYSHGMFVYRYVYCEPALTNTFIDCTYARSLLATLIRVCLYKCTKIHKWVSFRSRNKLKYVSNSSISWQVLSNDVFWSVVVFCVSSESIKIDKTKGYFIIIIALQFFC